MSAEAGHLWFEDVVVGRRVGFGSYRFTRDGIIDFATKYDPQAFHLDDEAARRSHFARLSASGWHTCAAFMKCCAAHNFALRDAAAARGIELPPLAPSPGFENLRWTRPVYADDEVSFFSTVTDKRHMASRPEWGIVFSHNEGINQNGETVMSFDGKLIMAVREGRK